MVNLLVFCMCVVDIFLSHGVCIEVFSNFFICCGVEFGFNTYADFSVSEFHSLLSFCSISMSFQCWGMRSKLCLNHFVHCSCCCFVIEVFHYSLISASQVEKS